MTSKLGVFPGARHPFADFLIALLFVAGGLFIGQFLALVLAAIFFHISFEDIVRLSENPLSVSGGRDILLLIQAVTSAVAFIGAPWFFLSVFGKNITLNRPARRTTFFSVLLVILLVLVFMPADAFVAEWNAHLKLPESLSAIEKLIREKEDTLEKLTKYLTDFKSLLELLLGFVVIALLPAVGEELVFRGLLQNILFRWTRNIHTAVWISAVLFSALHMQFYGFVPRLLLGAGFGYLYHWSGRLSISMLAHFVNNAFTLLMLYLYQNQMTDINIDAEDSVPVSWGLTSAILTMMLLIAFRKYYRGPSVSSSSDIRQDS